jgi:hypothetical protein
LEFPAPPSRTFAPTAKQITSARKAARAEGALHRALLYALVYDTTGRTFDFLGQWLPLSFQKPSAVLARGKKWIGPHWSVIDNELMLKMKPTKTEDTTAVEFVFDLSVCPMVMDELKRFPKEARQGPLIINEKTGLPYVYETFRDAWHRDFRAAGMPPGMLVPGPAGRWRDRGRCGRGEQGRPPQGGRARFGEDDGGV